MTAAKGSGVISNAYDGASRLVSTRVSGTGPRRLGVIAASGSDCKQ